MLCAKYSYKDDIAVKQREAREEGIQQGAQQKAIETALKALEIRLPPEQISQITGLSKEKILELQEQLTIKA